ncbi:MAG: exodeoxyribonuclease VII small subunit [Candidatus Pacebacteria bacterium]|nr:exodeoxyribonuclease VII small subunit [Candidatus Paceibacterota bacterium]
MTKNERGAGQDTNITDNLTELAGIVKWFESQQEVDVEEGLGKVREAAKLIKQSKARLADIENEFKEIEKEIKDDLGDESVAPVAAQPSTAKSAPAASEEISYPDEDVNPEDIPF